MAITDLIDQYEEENAKLMRRIAELEAKLHSTVEASPRQLWNIAATELAAENKRLRDAGAGLYDFVAIERGSCDLTEAWEQALAKGGD